MTGEARAEACESSGGRIDETRFSEKRVTKPGWDPREMGSVWACRGKPETPLGATGNLGGNLEPPRGQYSLGIVSPAIRKFEIGLSSER